MALTKSGFPIPFGNDGETCKVGGVGIIALAGGIFVMLIVVFGIVGGVGLLFGSSLTSAIVAGVAAAGLGMWLGGLVFKEIVQIFKNKEGENGKYFKGVLQINNFTDH